MQLSMLSNRCEITLTSRFRFKARGDSAVIALDNLKRRGSELARAGWRPAGSSFAMAISATHRILADTGSLDLLAECSAEPSVQAGLYGKNSTHQYESHGHGQSPRPRLPPGCRAIFLSTSRIYPIRRLCELPLVPPKLGLSSQSYRTGVFGPGHYRRVCPHRETTSSSGYAASAATRRRY
jgi:hypothetical protein